MAGKKRDEPGDLTTKILVQIRDELRKTNERLDKMTDRVEATNERLERRQTEDSVRLATEVVAVANAIGQVRDLLRDQRIDRKTIADHERRITALEKRTA
jgi:HAMP domain-containing protein